MYRLVGDVTIRAMPKRLSETTHLVEPQHKGAERDRAGDNQTHIKTASARQYYFENAKY